MAIAIPQAEREQRRAARQELTGLDVEEALTLDDPCVQSNPFISGSDLSMAYEKGWLDARRNAVCIPSLPEGWTLEHAAKAAWMINILAVTPPDEWRTKADLHETLSEFRSLHPAIHTAGPKP